MKHGRLIDADALIEAYDRAHEGEPGKARQLILDAPTIEERKTGKWIKVNGKTAINCSACYHCSWSRSFEDTVKQFNFCPNCGADMRKGEGEKE